LSRHFCRKPVPLFCTPFQKEVTLSRDVSYWLQQGLNILQLASFYVPLAVAFALLQGITRRVFLSFGDLAMYASFAAIYACFAALLRGDSDWMAAAFALLYAAACTGALGVAIVRGMLGRTLLGHAQAFMIASIGLSIALQETMRLQSFSRDIWIPPLFQGLAVFEFRGSFPLKMTLMTGIATALSAIILLIFLAVMRFARFGRQWRACTQSLDLARLCGVNVDRVVATTFVVAASLSAVSGWISAISYGGTNFTIGLMMGFKAMFASVVGGFGSLRGAALGAVLLATIEVIWSAAFSSTYRDVAVFVIIVLLLLLRPEGLQGIHQKRESEAL
jgi:branched-chain amino acid transport system permease protein